MASGREDFIAAIKTGDADFVRSYLRRNPDELNELLSFESHNGYALHCAALYDQPKIVSLLIREFKADPDQNRNVGCGWTPLHHAVQRSSYKAAGMLVSLGANPSTPNDSNQTTKDFCSSREVQQHADPGYEERVKRLEQEEIQRRIAGTWNRTGAREITHDYERPDIGCRLMDIFNFETRCLRAIVKNIDGQGMAQSILFFDDMPDKEILRPAAQKLQELGVDVDDSEIGEGRIIKKSFRPRSS